MTVCVKCREGIDHVVPHGTIAGYNYHLCRCGFCKNASFVYRRDLRLKDIDKALAREARNRANNPESKKRSRALWVNKNREYNLIRTKASMDSLKDRCKGSVTGKWSSHEDSVLLQNPELNISELCFMLDRSYYSVRERRSRIRKNNVVTPM